MRIKLKGLNKITKKLADGTWRTYWYAWKGGPPLRGEPGTPEFIVSYNEAVAKRKAELAPPPRPHSPITDKWRSFTARGIEPTCFLYRHFDAKGDLLYVGMSLHVWSRQWKHFQEAEWANTIYQIVIEPFASREELIEAEALAIKTEYPRHNKTHNDRTLRRALVAPAGEES